MDRLHRYFLDASGWGKGLGVHLDGCRTRLKGLNKYSESTRSCYRKILGQQRWGLLVNEDRTSKADVMSQKFLEIEISYHKVGMA